MHSWLPDAHSQAPAPVSGLMSGVLLSVALYAVLRLRSISDLALGPGFLRGVLLVLGVLSLTVAAALTSDPTRLQAPAGLFEHRAHGPHGDRGRDRRVARDDRRPGPHARARAGQVGDVRPGGRILRAEGSSSVADVVGLSARRPDLGGPWLVGTAALLGFPPFALFFTEVAIVIAGWSAGLAPVMFLVLALLLLTFVGISRQVLAMTLGPARAEPPAPQIEASAEQPAPRLGLSAQAPMFAALTAAVLAGALALQTGGALAAAVAGLGVTP
jgi:hydrogenase-4 component F